jgi:hypothetical protein
MTVFPEIVDLDDLPVRPVRRASLVFETGPGVRDELAVVFDADSAEFVRVPGSRPDAEIKSLSHDGTRLVLIDRGLDVHPQVTRVGIRVLATGEERWFTTPDYQQDQTAAFSPDGTVLAVMSHDDPCSEDGDPPVQAVIELLDLGTGDRRRIWQEPGAACDFGLAWSPDGRMIAATYIIWDKERDNDFWSTVVVDAADGTVRATAPFTGFRTWSNGIWLNDHTTVHDDDGGDDERTWLRHLGTGQTLPVPKIEGFWVIGTIHERLIHTSTTDDDAFITTRADGTDQHPLFALRPRQAGPSGFCLAPGAFPHW